MSRNNNRPYKGSRITVEPIRTPTEIETIKRLLKDRPRDLLRTDTAHEARPAHSGSGREDRQGECRDDEPVYL